MYKTTGMVLHVLAYVLQIMYSLYKFFWIIEWVYRTQPQEPESLKAPKQV